MVNEKDGEPEKLSLSPVILQKNDAIANQPRFSIMFLLYIHRSIGFTQLQRLLKLTPGNLDHHLKKLKKKDYVTMRKAISWRPLTIVEITTEGTNAFRTHVITLRKLLKLIV